MTATAHHMQSPLVLTAEDRAKAVESAKPVAEHVETTDLARAAEISPQEQTQTQTKQERMRDLETVALVVDHPKADFELAPIILDEVREDEVLIEMKYSGICHTDIVLQQGLLPMVEFPAIFGHEGAGIVREVGSAVTGGLKPGDAALLSFNTCGHCSPCRSSHPALCHNHPEVNHNAVRLSDRSTPARRAGTGTVEKKEVSVRSQYFGQSSFSKMSVVNARCVVKCSNPDAMAVYAPIGCGFQTGAGTVLNVLKPGRGDSVVIFGLGSVGLAALMAAKYMMFGPGAEGKEGEGEGETEGQIIAVDIVDDKLAMAGELGATDVVNSLAAGRDKEGGGVVGAVRRATRSGKGPTMAIDCTGIPRVVEDMVECLAPQGTAALVGVPPAGAAVKIDPLSFLLQNKKFLGVIEGDSNPPEFIPKLIDMHRQGHFAIDRLCRTYPVADLNDAIRDMHEGKVIKPVIDWS